MDRFHVADGFVDDCNELIQRCSKLEALTFIAFAEVWKEMNFACIYRGRQSGAEVAELSEEVLQLAKRYMVANTSNFKESVAGLFLVYALLKMQPYRDFAVLRIVPDDVPAINRIEQKKVPMYEQVFEKRRRLSSRRKNQLEEKTQRDHKKQYECNSTSKIAKPVIIASTSKTSDDSPKDAVIDQEGIFDYDSDDSVKDKNYEPEEDIGSSDSEIIISEPSKHRKDEVKRQLFSYTPKKLPINADARNDSELITIEDLLGPQKACDLRTDRSPDLDVCLSPPSKKLCLDRSPNLDVCLSPPPKKLCLDRSPDLDICLTPSPKKLCFDKTIVHINEMGYLSDNSDSPPLKETPLTSTAKDCSNAMVLYNKTKRIMTHGQPNSITAITYGIMSIDNSGIIYLPNITNDTSSRTNASIIRETDSASIQDTSGSKKVKKKIADPTKWKRIASKIARLKGPPYRSTVAKKKQDVEGRELKPPCSCKAKCYLKISHDKRLQVFNQFWKVCRNWDQRRQFIINNVKKETKKTMKTDGNLETDRRKFSYKYKLTVDYLEVNVCKVMFLNTLSIGEKFLKVSIDKKLEGGLTIGDQRGKHVPGNKSPALMIKMVMDHIDSYPSYESHYSREKTGKKYLGPDLNIPLMYKQYKELMVTEKTPENLIAKEWLYRNIFNTKFNLSFKLPSVDTCDTCDAYERKLKDIIDDTEKQEIERKQEEHRELAEERYNLKKKDKEEALESSEKKRVLMFDLQKCLATPNLTNTQSFYLRKLWTLNLTIYDATKNVATNMIWSENISGRGGNEVASCLIRWAEENKSQIADVEELTFWSDNCAGQNRNLMIVMAYIWLLHKHSHLKVINHKFMLKGHTHMEVDQVHSRIERQKKKLKTMQIAIPRDWSQFIRTCGKSRTFEVFDMGLEHFKDLTSLYKKGGPLVTRKKSKDGKEFKISECVWLQVKQEEPGILYYKSNFSDAFSKISLVRNNQRSNKLNFPEELSNVRSEEKAISSAKYNDLTTLLQWVPAEFHNFYKNLKHDTNAPDFPEAD